MVAVTETWFTPNIVDCELLPGSDFTIYRRDRVSGGGRVMLAVRNTINSIRRSDLECSAEELVCEIRPSLKRKLLIVVFYRPPDSNLDYLKELKKSFRLANQARFDQLVVCGNFNLPHIDWEFGTATTGDSIHNYFTKLVRDNYLWQMIDFPTRNNNMLDLILTNIPEKISDIHGFDDILNTNHKLVSFALDFNIPKKFKTKRFVYNFKKANWDALKKCLLTPPGTCSLFLVISRHHCQTGVIFLFRQ